MTVPAEYGAPYAAALYLAVIQFLFVTCWTLYVIFLPELLAGAGLSRSLAPPHAPAAGAFPAAALIALILVWTMISSALRAPPWAIAEPPCRRAFRAVDECPDAA